MWPGQVLPWDNLSLLETMGLSVFLFISVSLKTLILETNKIKNILKFLFVKIPTKLGWNPILRHSLPPPPNCPSRHKTSSWAIESYIYIRMTFRKIEDWKLHIQVKPVIRDNEIQSEENTVILLKRHWQVIQTPNIDYQNANCFRIHHKHEHGFLLTSVKTCFCHNCALCQKHLELTYLKYNF